MTSTADMIAVNDIRTVSYPEQGYMGWPTIARQRSGRLMIVSSAGRKHHVCPFGQVHYQFSDDNGETWTTARVLVDGIIDDRDAGVLETSRGTLLVNWFTSLAWENKIKAGEEGMANIPDHERAEWYRRQNALNDHIRRSELGCWMIRSTDGGVTWSPRIDTQANSPHGPIELADGRLLYPGKRRLEQGPAENGSPFAPNLGAAISEDDGLTWQWIGDVPLMPGHQPGNYHEPHGVQAADGRVIVHIRNHTEPHRYEILQTESSDGGKTWSVPRCLGYFGYPCHLIRLHDDTLLSTFSHRKDPRGNYVILSTDHGRTWSEPQPIATGINGDFGYPATVELPDHQLLTVWYQAVPGEPRTELRLARWRLSR